MPKSVLRYVENAVNEKVSSCHIVWAKEKFDKNWDKVNFFE